MTLPTLDWDTPRTQRRMAAMYRREDRKMARWIRRHKIDTRTIIERSSEAPHLPKGPR